MDGQRERERERGKYLVQVLNTQSLLPHLDVFDFDELKQYLAKSTRQSFYYP
jgi:hypothetical protein